MNSDIAIRSTNEPEMPLIINGHPDVQFTITNEQVVQNQIKGTSTNHFKIMYANIRGFKGKKTSLLEILDENKPHLFLLTETQLRSNSVVKIDGYEFLAE